MAKAGWMIERFGHYSNRGRRKIASLIRRADHLKARIINSPNKDLTFDKQELAALDWALQQLEALDEARLPSDMGRCSAATLHAEVRERQR